MGSLITAFPSEWNVDSVRWIIGTALCFPLAYFAYNVCTFMNEMRRIGREVDKLPGEAKHWFYGNLRQVHTNNSDLHGAFTFLKHLLLSLFLTYSNVYANVWFDM